MVAQQVAKERFLYYNARLHYGSMIIHSREIQQIGNANPYGFELTLGRQAWGADAWDACNCYPRTGISLSYWHFDRPAILGNGYFANFFIEPVFGGWNKWFFSIKAATGLAYLTKPFDSITNPKNQSYSTRFSFPLHLGATLNYRMNDKFNFNLTLIYNHTSNGGLREPNKGINWPTLALGVDVKPQSVALIKRESSRYAFKDEQRFHTTISFFGTAKQLNHAEFQKYFIGGLTFEGNYRVSRLSLLAVGALLEWDETDKEEIKRSETIMADHKKFSMYAGHEFLLGKFTFSQAIGVYLYDQYKANDPVYHQYALMYSLIKPIRIGMHLKAHRHVADYAAIKISYSL